MIVSTTGSKAMQSMEERRLREEQRKSEARRIRRRKRKRQQRIVRGVTGVTVLMIVLVAGLGISRVVKNKAAETEAQVIVEETKYIAERPELIVELLDINQYSRPGTALEKVNGIVVHYTANPGDKSHHSCCCSQVECRKPQYRLDAGRSGPLAEDGPGAGDGAIPPDRRGFKQRKNGHQRFRRGNRESAAGL